MDGIIEYLASACKPTNETQAQVSMNEQYQAQASDQ